MLGLRVFRSNQDGKIRFPWRRCSLMGVDRVAAAQRSLGVDRVFAARVCFDGGVHRRKGISLSVLAVLGAMTAAKATVSSESTFLWPVSDRRIECVVSVHVKRMAPMYCVGSRLGWRRRSLVSETRHGGFCRLGAMRRGSRFLDKDIFKIAAVVDVGALLPASVTPSAGKRRLVALGRAWIWAFMPGSGLGLKEASGSVVNLFPTFAKAGLVKGNNKT